MPQRTPNLITRTCRVTELREATTRNLDDDALDGRRWSAFALILGMLDEAEARLTSGDDLFVTVAWDAASPLLTRTLFLYRDPEATPDMIGVLSETPNSIMTRLWLHGGPA